MYFLEMYCNYNVSSGSIHMCFVFSLNHMVTSGRWKRVFVGHYFVFYLNERDIAVKDQINIYIVMVTTQSTIVWQEQMGSNISLLQLKYTTQKKTAC